jgi:hypothetical protein
VGTPSTGTVTGGGSGAGGYSAPGSGNSTVSPIFGTPGGPGGGSPAGPGGFAGPGGPGGLSSPAVFAFRLPSASPGTGGVSAFAVAVASLAGCFYTLTPYEQQVLTVRTGLDGRQPLTRAQAASMLGTSPAAVGRTERTALGQLGSAARTDGCMAIGGSSPANALTAFIGGPFGPVGFVTPALAPGTRTSPGATEPPGTTNLTSTSFADRLTSLGGGTGEEASISILVILAVMFSAALAALLLEARRSVH